MDRVTEKQPPSANTDGVRVLDYVLDDITARAKMGYIKHEKYLETRNGRDPLWDAYQEAIDCVMYLKQALLERDGK